MHNAIGFVQILFQSIGHIAPAVGVAYAVTVGVAYAGGAISFAVLLALIACLLVAASIWQLARHLPSAGGLYTYSSHGLGPSMGFLVGWGYIGAEPLAFGFLTLVFGNALSSYLTVHFGAPTWLWAPFAVVMALFIWAIVYRGIKLSTGTNVFLGVLEITIFVALALTLIVNAGSRNTLAVLGPHTANPRGTGGIFAGMIFAIFAFIGFDGAAPLAEEAAEPRKTVGRGIFFATLFIGVFFLFCYYAATVYYGPARLTNSHTAFVTFNGGDPWTGMATQVWGVAGVFVLIAILNSALANGNAAANAATRVGYALGRIRLFPGQLSLVHPRFKTPWVAIHVEVIFSVSLSIALGFAFGSPLTAFAFLGTIGTLIFIPLYMLTCVASCVFYLREHRDEFNVFLHVVIPVGAVVLFIPVMLAGLGINFLGLGITPLAWPINLAPYISLAWVVIGIGMLFYFRARHPNRIADTAEIFLDEGAEKVSA
jgi:amino acid transporter